VKKLIFLLLVFIFGCSDNLELDGQFFVSRDGVLYCIKHNVGGNYYFEKVDKKSYYELRKIMESANSRTGSSY